MIQNLVIALALTLLVVALGLLTFLVIKTNMAVTPGMSKRDISRLPLNRIVRKLNLSFRLQSKKFRKSRIYTKLFKRRGPKKKFGTFGQLLLVGLGLTLLYYIGKLIVYLWSSTTGYLEGFSLGRLTAVGIVLSILLVIDIVFLAGGKNKDGGRIGWRERWSSWRPKMYFGILWTIIVFMGNVLLWHLDAQAWYSLWNYKNAGNTGGSWVHYVIMGFIVLSMLLMVNVKIPAVRVGGGILFAMMFTTWMYIWASTVNFPTPREIVRNHLQAPGSPVHDARVQSLLPTEPDDYEEVVVLKGQSRTFVIEDVLGIDDVHFTYRFDGRGKPIDRPRGQRWQHNPKRNITYELKPLDSDMIVKLRR